ncbi:hypothetical protein AB0K86_20000 [Streptomyces clavifer]|uniref:hypothetical protein n=1 Tax=Streptomyces clavifer TaxID=68188 RepID=UPI00341D9ECF
MTNDTPRITVTDRTIARSLGPAIEALREQMAAPARRFAEIMLQYETDQTRRNQLIIDTVRRQMLDSTMQPQVQQAIQRMQADLHMTFSQVAGNMARQRVAFEGLSTAVAAYQAQMRRSAASVSVLHQSWLDRISQNLAGMAFAPEARTQMARFFDDLYDSIDDEAMSSQADEIEGLDEITQQGLTFVASEGQGLSREAQGRLLSWFVCLAVFGVLMQAVVASDAVKDLLEDAAVPASIAMTALIATRQEWNRRNPNPAGQDDEDEGTETGRTRR